MEYHSPKLPGLGDVNWGNFFAALSDVKYRGPVCIEVEDKALMRDLRNEIIKYLDKNFKGNINFIKIVKSSVFCSENNNIVSDNYKITKNEKIAIIPPIGGG